MSFLEHCEESETQKKRRQQNGSDVDQRTRWYRGKIIKLTKKCPGVKMLTNVPSVRLYFEQITEKELVKHKNIQFLLG
jgi:hypothetical protein